jgi:hypothetical protein
LYGRHLTGLGEQQEPKDHGHAAASVSLAALIARLAAGPRPGAKMGVGAAPSVSLAALMALSTGRPSTGRKNPRSVPPPVANSPFPTVVLALGAGPASEIADEFPDMTLPAAPAGSLAQRP